MIDFDTEPAEVPAPVEVEADHPAVTMYTSGTTADPKGVVLTHGNLVGEFEGVFDAVRIDETDSVLQWFQIADLAMGTPVVNTGLVGAPDGIAYALRSEFVGVVSSEADEGAGGGCDLNDDGDRQDDVFRWVPASNGPGTAPGPSKAVGAIWTRRTRLSTSAMPGPASG